MERRDRQLLGPVVCGPCEKSIPALEERNSFISWLARPGEGALKAAPERRPAPRPHLPQSSAAHLLGREHSSASSCAWAKRCARLAKRAPPAICLAQSKPSYHASVPF